VSTSTTCSGKRKKRALPSLPEESIASGGDANDEQLSASLADEAASIIDSNGDEKFLLWTTTTTTLTFTSSTTKSGTKLSLSYACTVSGMNTFAACG